MDWYASIFELIDMRSFSNLWFWIALAVTWSSASHWVVGVPYDLVTRARRVGGQVERDLEDLARIHCNRILYISRVSGIWLWGGTCFVLSTLAMLGFYYAVELAQAVFLIACPMSVVGLISIATARRIEAGEDHGEPLRKRLTRARTYIQLVGTLSILVTALWGMYQNLSISVLN